MERCPCCKARLGGALSCPRCQADLSKAIAARQVARFWLAEALRHWQENQLERSVNALELSLRLHQTAPAAAFRDYLIDRQSQAVLEFLAQKHPLAAAQRLYQVRLLLPHSELLRKLRAFTDYLLAKQPETKTSQVFKTCEVF